MLNRYSARLVLASQFCLNFFHLIDWVAPQSNPSWTGWKRKCRADWLSSGSISTPRVGANWQIKWDLNIPPPLFFSQQMALNSGVRSAGWMLTAPVSRLENDRFDAAA